MGIVCVMKGECECECVSVSVRVICPFSVDRQLFRGRLCEQWVCELASYVDLSPHTLCTRTVYTYVCGWVPETQG